MKEACKMSQAAVREVCFPPPELQDLRRSLKPPHCHGNGRASHQLLQQVNTNTPHHCSSSINTADTALPQPYLESGGLFLTVEGGGRRETLWLNTGIILRLRKKERRSIIVKKREKVPGIALKHASLQQFGLIHKLRLPPCSRWCLVKHFHRLQARLMQNAEVEMTKLQLQPELSSSRVLWCEHKMTHESLMTLICKSFAYPSIKKIFYCTECHWAWWCPSQRSLGSFTLDKWPVDHRASFKTNNLSDHLLPLIYPGISMTLNI